VALLVVPLGTHDTERLTLAEWDALVARETVFFETESHPLATRLSEAGVEVGFGAPMPNDDRAALVVEPDSPRTVELAKQGARVTSGVAIAPDSLTAARGAYLTRRGAGALGSLALVMARLRSSDGCPWDQEQTHQSLRIHLLEESYEVLDAIDRGHFEAELEEELGDLLLQVAFHAQLAADDHRFDLAGVAERIAAKLIHRHPHVFGETSVANAAEVVANWETIKRDEKQERSGPFDGIPPALPALLAAYKVQKRAASLGFQPDGAETRDQMAEALAADAVGDALFWLVALARARGVDPEGALREATARFRSRYEDD